MNHIIVRMPNWLGDLVMATPILADLRHHWPQAKITAMCQGSIGLLLQKDPHIDSIFYFKKPSGWFDKAGRTAILNHLKQEKYDLAILLTHSFSSAYWFWRSQIPHRLGFIGQGRKWLINHPVPFPIEKEHQHLVTTYKTLLHPLGISTTSTSPHLYITTEEEKAVQHRLEEYGILSSDFLIGINPGAAYGSAKCWLPERFHQLTKQLLDFPQVKVIFFGDQTSTSLIENICKNLSNRVINLAGKTSLRELLALIKACHLFLTNDSGPMHIASAVKTPLIALFGSTSDQITGPYKGGEVIHKHVSCSPCYRRQCPIDFRCMTRIEVNEVYDKIRKFLE